VIDEGMGDEIRVTLIATGFDKHGNGGYGGYGRGERQRGPVDRGPRIDERQRSSLEISDDDIDIPPFLRDRP
jgi:cell division protein FtsZ